jgi:membrane-bound lytic murein transglycosylase B
MGYGQFIPSSYRAYAVDFDGDGVADIWHNPVDAIGSVANYFVRNGWRAGEPVVSRAVFSESGDPAIFDGELKPTRTVAGLESRGLVAAQTVDADALATAVRFEQPEGFEYWMGLHNFYVITRYNRSNMYAMAVFQLSQRIARGARE